MSRIRNRTLVFVLIFLLALLSFVAVKTLDVHDEQTAAPSVASQTEVANVRRDAPRTEIPSKLPDREMDRTNSMRDKGVAETTQAAAAMSTDRPFDRPSEQRSGEARGISWAGGIDPTGIPFPTSDSIRNTCAEYSGLKSGSCRDHEAALTRLAKEGRDEKWAPLMEDAIASLVAPHQNYSIRSIDCRTTVCAVEIESILGVFDRSAPEKLKNKLERVDTINGYERNDSNQRVTVTAISFKRK